jgi:tRNA(Ile)-lysidine synthase
MKRPNRVFSKMPQKRSQLALAVRDRVRRGVYGQPLFGAGDRVGVAVSGGADSVALLRLLLELREELGIVLSVVHLNHQLRGRAAERDEQFVTKLAERYGLELFVEHVNVGAKAKREKLNVEDAARRARYEFFASLVKAGKVARVATAHTADDQAETVLAHMLRGAGLAGISGIHPVSGEVVRPVLGIRRAALRAYLKSAKQTWREDATNRDTTKLRARIRKKLIPLLEKQFQPAAVDHLAKLAQFAREDDLYLETAAEARCGQVAKRTATRTAIPCRELHGPAAICGRMVRCIVKELKVREAKSRTGEPGATHVEAALALAEFGKNGTSLHFPGGIEVRREGDELVFAAGEAKQNKTRARSKHASKSRAHDFEHTIDFSGSETIIGVPCLQRSFRFTKIDWPEKSEETSTNGSVLNHDALRKPLVLRNWRPGDTFQPTGHRKPHKLKRLLNEKSVSRWERDGWPVLTSAGVIAWARGFSVGAAFAATSETTSAIRIEEYATSSH